jgi:hypothetical protein
MPLFLKISTIILLALIFFSLGSALFFLVRGGDKNNSTRIVKALTWRIALSILLFVMLLVGFALGWITPHSIV